MMGKDFIPINAGRVILTKVDPLTGALSKKPEDRRILTEVCDSISKKKSLKTYDIPDGNSNYPAATLTEGVEDTIGIGLNTLTDETLAFLQNSKINKAAGTIKEFAPAKIPDVAPYEIKTLGKIVGDPIVLDSEDVPFTKAEGEVEPTTKQFKVTAGTLEEPDKIVFSADDAGKEIFLVYTFEAKEVTSYDEDENPINPVVQIEIIHETLSRDKTKRYKNNSIISRAQLSGDIDQTLKKQAGTTTLNFKTVKPAGSKVVYNKKTEIPLN